MDSDKVLVMNYGVAAEFDSPRKLLERNDGIFRSLVFADGTDTAHRLIELANKTGVPLSPNEKDSSQILVENVGDKTVLI